jgi:hypothetical protein
MTRRSDRLSASRFQHPHRKSEGVVVGRAALHERTIADHFSQHD